MVSFAVVEQNQEKRKKAIPSQVFFNHFFAINYHLESQTDRYECKKCDYFNKLKVRNPDFKVEKVKKFLWNSWSTEYAHSLTSIVDNEEYYKFALHWNFPQAYYSIYLNMTAFHETQGIANEQHEKSIKLFGTSVKDNHYPNAVSFHCKGLHEDFNYNGLDTFEKFPKEFSGLGKINSLDEAQIQIASFLKSTRKKNAQIKREKLKANNDKKFLSKKGEFRKTFFKEHWDYIYQTIPETTILNIMYRLRIKANYHDIDTFINADIDFKSFHYCLSNIISYLNYIHEAYIYKCIGEAEYEKILLGFPNHLNESTAKQRFDDFKRK